MMRGEAMGLVLRVLLDQRNQGNPKKGRRKSVSLMQIVFILFATVGHTFIPDTRLDRVFMTIMGTQLFVILFVQTISNRCIPPIMSSGRNILSENMFFRVEMSGYAQPNHIICREGLNPLFRNSSHGNPPC